MFRTLVAFCLALVFGSAVSSVQAQINRGDRWTKLATENVDLKSGLASIDLSKRNGSFKAFRLRMARGGIRFTQIQFLYADGTVHQVDKAFRLERRERTKPLDLRSEERFIEQVNIEFDPNTRSRSRARLEIWGLQSRKGRRAKRPQQPEGSSVESAEAATRVDGKPPLPTRLSGGGSASDGDVLFGAEYIGFDVDKDVIPVGRKVGKFNKIRLKVHDSDIFINDIKVIYETGEPELISLNTEILTDAQTDWLDLKGDRFVKEIHLSYRSKPDFEGQARVELFGLHAEGWLGPEGEGRKFNDGWVLLGARPAGFIGFDRHTIPVGKNVGGFREIRVSVRERAITLNQIRVVYNNGQEDIIPVRSRVDAGSTFGPIALRQTGNEINKIVARYRSRFIDRSAAGKGNAIVEVWAKH